ncbi:hypothetical protein PV10_05782 [Exophiala mesophila]|uniref:Signal peptidase complex subunit 1 n=1 Tax=Exophiala mesophila TaxID=212818 RepID=A0A0D1WQ77_EXOME|nr:uncharacterized protein PV10_05782 [Exophiala mesophila]KIV91220.1 hypothetical protein PV10_05782 [Exophiala mesophila]
MDDILAQAQDIFEAQIDFKGQYLAENIYTILLSITSALALVLGYAQQDIYLTLWVGLAGTILSMFVVVPAWPFFNQNPQPWLGSTAALLSKGVIVDGSAKMR